MCIRDRDEYDIMLGTQMVAKGLDFEKVTLVGVLGIDQLLFAQGYKAVSYTHLARSCASGRYLRRRYHREGGCHHGQGRGRCVYRAGKRGPDDRCRGLHRGPAGPEGSRYRACLLYTSGSALAAAAADLCIVSKEGELFLTAPFTSAAAGDKLEGAGSAEFAAKAGVAAIVVDLSLIHIL